MKQNRLFCYTSGTGGTVPFVPFCHRPRCPILYNSLLSCYNEPNTSGTEGTVPSVPDEVRLCREKREKRAVQISIM